MTRLPSPPSMQRKVPVLVRTLALAAALLVAMPAFAQSREAPRPGQSRPAPTPTTAPAARPTSTTRAPSKVGLQVLVVHATDSTTGVDPRIKGLESSFRYFKYKGYKLLSTENADVAVNDTASFSIAGNRKVKVTALSIDDARTKLHVEILAGDSKLFDTTVNINRGGTFIISGPRFEDGILMLPVRATY